MGNYSTEQRAAIIANKARFRHVWTFLHPEDHGDPITSEIVLHNGVDIIRVTDAGSIETEAYNQTLQEPGDFRTNNYKFTLDNSDNYLSYGRPGSIWYYEISPGLFAIFDPIECNIRHQVYIGIAGVWTELTFLTYIGGISDVSYRSIGSKGEALNKTATFTCNNRTITAILKYVWDSTDGTDTDTGIDFNTTGDI